MPAKLLIAIVESHNSELLIAASKEAGASGGTKAFARGTAVYNASGGRAEADVQETVIFILMYDKVEEIDQSIVKTAAEDPENFNGMALVLDVPAVLARADTVLPSSIVNAPGKAPVSFRSKPMKSETLLICSIINHGEADDIMLVARNAGAKGGTILNARGTGTENDVRFFGISLAPEKEMLLIVADQDKAQAILNAISSLSVFGEPGGGIVFTTSVEQLILFGK
jgi:nitrogen regulatory protein PII